MTPTLDELIYCTERLVETVSESRHEEGNLYVVGVLHALQRLRELEAPVKDPLTTDGADFTAVPVTERRYTVEKGQEVKFEIDEPIVPISGNPGVPSVDEVGDMELCWVWYQPDYDTVPTWCLYLGYIVRKWTDFYTHWLPKDAIPMPNEGETQKQFIARYRSQSKSQPDYREKFGMLRDKLESMQNDLIAVASFLAGILVYLLWLR